MKSRRLSVWAAVAASLGMGLWLSGGATRAASHSDAPLIKQDPQANITDVYAFVGTKYDDSSVKVLNVVVHVRPFSEPGDGVIYDRFADDALYSIHITNPATGAEVLRYNFQFSEVNPLTRPGLKNPNTILSYGLGTQAGPIMTVGDARQNYTQTYTVTKVNGGASTYGRQRTADAAAQRRQAHDAALQRHAPAGRSPARRRSHAGLVHPADRLRTGLRRGRLRRPARGRLLRGHAGHLRPARLAHSRQQREPRRRTRPGRQRRRRLQGLQRAGVRDSDSDLVAADLHLHRAVCRSGQPAARPRARRTGVGVYASVSRPRVTLRRTDGDPRPIGPLDSGQPHGQPALQRGARRAEGQGQLQPDAAPPGDKLAFATYALNPELAFLINFVFGTIVCGERAVPTSRRCSSRTCFESTRPRLPVRLSGQAGFSRFGFAGGDTTTDNGGRIKSSGWPNGRRFGDDVVDIALTAIASGPTYNPVIVVGDNVAANDQVFNQVFPYSATPHAGPRNQKDSGVNK